MSENYYNSKFAGNEGLVWRTLTKGYFECFKELADDYWIDTYLI
ncbi:MAG: hypothetical protein ABJH82_01225 [Polaribacter sp.]